MWFVVAVCRSFEHLLFDRAFDKERSVFEFFLPEELEECFLELMEYFTSQGIAANVVRLPNRIQLGSDV